LLVEITILHAASKQNAAQVLRDATTAYKVDVDAISLKVKQEFAAKEKAKLAPKPAAKATQPKAEKRLEDRNQFGVCFGRPPFLRARLPTLKVAPGDRSAMFFPPDGLEKALTAPSPQSQFQCELPSEDAVPSYTECGQKGHNATPSLRFPFPT